MQAARLPRRPTQHTTARATEKSRILESGLLHVGWLRWDACSSS